MKRSIKTFALLLMLCLAAGGYYLVQNLGQETAAVNQAEGSFALIAHAADELNSLAYTKDDKALRFTTSGSGEWQVADNADFPLDSDAVQSMADSLTAMTATRKLTDVTSLADYGLAEPAFTVTAAWSDGTETTYAMGSATPFADGYYLYLTGDASTVYTVSQSLSSVFSKTMNNLAVIEDIPAATNVTRLTIGSALDAVWQENSTTIDPDQHWYAADGTPLDGSEMDSLISKANGLTFSTVTNGAPTAEQLTEYQLNDTQAVKIVLYDGENAARSLLIGASTSSSTYYAKRPGSVIVYTISATEVDSLLNATTASLAVTDLVPLSYENLASGVFVGDGVNYTLQHSAAVDAAETANNTEITEPAVDPGENVWALVRGLTCSEVIEEKDGSTILSITITSVNGMTEKLSISSYDVEHYQISVDGHATQLVSAEQVDKLIRTLKSMQ